MATVLDVDVQSLVKKYLERQTVTPPTDETADTSEEISSLLESIAISFLLYPDAALTIFVRAKNTLAQTATDDLGLIAFLRQTLPDLTNPTESISDTSALTEAQTALVELDKIGKIQAGVQPYDRYTAAVSNFLNTQLAPSLKRNGRNQFARTGSEAGQDLVNYLATFQIAHALFIKRLKSLYSAIDNFHSVPLTAFVSQKTLQRVRLSIQQLINAANQGTLSHTVAAIEVLAGSASLQSISKTRDVYDPTIDTVALFPNGRKIVVDTEPVAAAATTSAGPWDISAISTPWQLSVGIDGATPVVIELPGVGISGRAYLRGSPITFPLVTTTGSLFLNFNLTDNFTEVILPPATYANITALVAALNTALGVSAFGVFAHIGNSVTFVGAAAVTPIYLYSVGRANITRDISGNPIYNAPNASIHATLKMTPGQSGVVGRLSRDELVQAFADQNPAPALTPLAGQKLTIASTTLLPTSALVLSGSTRATLGLPTTAAPQPTYVTLREGVTTLSPLDEGVYDGSLVVLGGSYLGAVLDVQGQKVTLSPTPPAGIGLTATITSPLVTAVQLLLKKLQDLLTIFDADAQRLQQVTPALFSNPTVAQINDADSVFAAIQTRIQSVQTALASMALSDDRILTSGVANKILLALQERGMDRAQDLLLQCDFASFFALTGENASRSTRLMKAMETVGQADLPPQTVESSQPNDPIPVAGVNPDTNPLPRANYESTNG